LNIDLKASQSFISGNNALKKGNFNFACQHYEYILKYFPDCAIVHNNLAIALCEQGQLTKACFHLKEALQIQNDYSDAYINLASTYKLTGNIKLAIENYQKAIKYNPSSQQAKSNLLLCLNYSLDYSTEEIFQAHKTWGDSFKNKNINNFKIKNKKIKIAYISPDFRNHSVSYFFKPILENHNKDLFEIICYSNVSCPDNQTNYLQKLADKWVNIYSMNDDSVINQIKNDNINVLVDLAGHTAGNRLLVFTNRAAPVQISYLGYPNTTGLNTIDYKISDPFSDPISNNSDDFYTEKLIRLNNAFFCYPSPDINIDIAPLPALTNKYITFGAFHDLAKISDSALETWMQILHEIKSSKIILQSRSFDDLNIRNNYIDFFKKNNINENRIQLTGYKPFEQFLKLHENIDIMLDTFPWNGHTTSCHSLWMGISQVTLSGDRQCFRLGKTLLSNLNLENFITYSKNEYIQKAVELANNIQYLNKKRISLRETILKSNLTNYKTITKEIEKLFIDSINQYKMLNSNINKIPKKINTSKNALFYFTQGNDLYERKEYNESIKYFIKALKIDPNYYDAYFNMGNAFFILNKFKDAVYCFKKLSEIDSTNYNALINLGLSYSKISEFSKAIFYYNESIKINPQNSSAYFNLANCYNQINEIDMAIKYYLKVLQLNPKSCETYNNLGVMRGKKNDFKNAYECFKKAIDLNPDYVEAHANFGDVLKDAGMLYEALNHYQKAFSINPFQLYPLTQIYFIEHQLCKPGLWLISLKQIIQNNKFNEWFKQIQNSDGIDFITGYLMELEKNFTKAIEFYNYESKKVPGAGWVFTRKIIASLKNKFNNNLSEFYQYQITSKYENQEKCYISMSNLGLIGRFGNQLLQYMNLKLYAYRNNLIVQTPDWSGRYFFKGIMKDMKVSKEMPCYSMQDISYKKSINGNIDKILTNVDIKCRDFAQLPHITEKEKNYLVSIFEVLPFWNKEFDSAMRKISSFGKNLVSIHLRRGDFITEDQHFVTPDQWYVKWLNSFWNNLEDPVLYIASDEIEKVKDSFNSFNSINLTNVYNPLQEIEFFFDFYVLMHSNIVAASYKSTFSKIACMLNTKTNEFYHPDIKNKCLIKFNPWLN